MAQVIVRATVTLTGLRAGAIAVVDSSDPYIAALIRDGVLVVEKHAARRTEAQ